MIRSTQTMGRTWRLKSFADDLRRTSVRRMSRVGKSKYRQQRQSIEGSDDSESSKIPGGIF